MKTLLFHVNTFLAGGIEKVLIELLHALDPQQYRIKLSIGYNFGEKEVLKAALPAYVEVCYLVSNTILTSTQKKKKTGKLGLAEKLLGEAIFPILRKRLQKKKLREIVADVDVVIDFDTTLSGFYKIFAHKKNAAYCHFSFSQIWNGSKRKGNKLAHRLSRYDKIVMLCDEMKEETAALYPILAPKLVRIYNALNSTRLRRMADEPLNIPALSGDNYIVSVGRLQESQKDFTTLIKAYAMCVQEHNIREQLIIVGDGSSMESLKMLAVETGQSHRIIFAGYQKNPYNWIKGASVFLFSSKYEGLPTVIIESMLLRRPVIATECPTGVRELLSGGEAGMLIKVGDVAQMSASIFRLLSTPALQDELVAKSIPFLANFDTAHMIAAFERLIIR